MPSPTILKYVAFTLMALFGLLGGAFVLGETFSDPGGWTAVWVSALWVVPLVAMSVFALLRPEAMAPVFVVVTAVVALFTLVDSLVGIIPRDDWGPVAAIVVFALGVALAFLGLRRALLAGTLMATAAVTQLVAQAVEDGRAARPDLHLGVCGEHGGDPDSIHFFDDVGLDYVSCSPFRVPVARLEAGRSVLAKRRSG